MTYPDFERYPHQIRPSNAGRRPTQYDAKTSQALRLYDNFLQIVQVFFAEVYR